MNAPDSPLARLSTCAQVDTIRRSRRASRRDPWRETLVLLDQLCAHCDDNERRAAHSPRHIVRAQNGTPVITVLERLSEKTIALRWCSTSCHYGDQIWVKGIARTGGVCVMTGRRIEAGDAIYRPRKCGSDKPINANAMAHLAAFEHLPPCDRKTKPVPASRA
ncbi:DUF3331 domain-containing protein [Paraburkholderia sp. C35]|uniref:DUF3331 domain-containing protein n=1 Tax=Paraburkholderia sp. C35 TaxID=2126993 RepID=UPI000D69277E|nr:DUF3331 domain-containing protein [Paraburkholderia sp. C35]